MIGTIGMGRIGRKVATAAAVGLALGIAIPASTLPSAAFGGGGHGGHGGGGFGGGGFGGGHFGGGSIFKDNGHFGHQFGGPRFNGPGGPSNRDTGYGIAGRTYPLGLGSAYEGLYGLSDPYGTSGGCLRTVLTSRGYRTIAGC